MIGERVEVRFLVCERGADFLSGASERWCPAAIIGESEEAVTVFGLNPSGRAATLVVPASDEGKSWRRVKRVTSGP